MKKLIIALSAAGVIAIGLYIAVIGIVLQQLFDYQEPVQAQPAAVQPHIVQPPTSTEVEAKINEFRTQQGLAAFNSEVPALDEAAQVRADGMCTSGDWSHAHDWEVLAPYYNYSIAGENLYYGTLRDNQSSDALTAWVASPKHLENLVKNYTQIGVGVKSCPGFQGDARAVIITNYFGVPR